VQREYKRDRVDGWTEGDSSRRIRRSVEKEIERVEKRRLEKSGPQDL
jgi:hypothetical protein